MWQRLVGLHLTAVIGCLALALGTASWSWAQCNPDAGCGGCQDKGERMKCKFDAFVNAGKQTIDLLQQSPYSDRLTPAQLEGLRKSKDRLDREKGRLKAEDFKLLTKKRSAGCQLVEKTGNDDGVCQPELGEQCAEVVGDGIGDEDGICSPMKGKGREVCAQICDQEAILESEDNVDDDASAELESTYDDLTSHLEEVNATLPEVAASYGSSLGLLDGEPDPCALNTQLSRFSDETQRKATWAVMGSRAAADVAERFCDQTFTSVFLTWTVGVACIAAESVVVGLTVWLTVVEAAEDALDAMTIDATLGCARQAMTASGEVSAKIQGVKAKVEAVKAKQAEIITLINTPPGQREGFPKP